MERYDFQKQIAADLEVIRKLMIVGLIRQGASQSDIAQALGVNQSSISRMFPASDKKRRTKKTSPK